MCDRLIFDTDGNKLHAHGGCISYFNGYYYWYGQDIRGKNLVSCYRSKDFKNWEFRNTILTCESDIQPLPQCKYKKLKSSVCGRKVILERPKILYNKKTKKYVMWAHYENGRNYNKACACVAVCDTPDGNFVYHGAFRPFGNMSRDCTLYQENEKAYFISASNHNLDLKVYELTEDYLNVSKEVCTLFAGEEREAPALFKKDDMYFLLSSACTGWTPNQGKYAFSKHIEGPWSDLYDFGDKTTFHSQPAFVLPKDGEYIYAGDEWGGDGKKFLESKYVFLPIVFDGNKIKIKNSEKY